tara:strand:+ start:495 stop:941 length:447 start_codon:yes stop_codon:yes gene_type:complete
MNLTPHLHHGLSGILDDWSCRMVVRVQYIMLFLFYGFFYLHSGSFWKGQLYDEMIETAHPYVWGAWFLLLALVQSTSFYGPRIIRLAQIRSIFFLLGTATTCYMFIVPLVLYAQSNFMPAGTGLIFNNLILFVWCAITAKWPLKGKWA